MKTRAFLVLLTFLGVVAISGCENELETEINAYDCVPVISNPTFVYTVIEGSTICTGGSFDHQIAFTLDYDGCVDVPLTEQTSFTYYTALGDVLNKTSNSQNVVIIGDKVRYVYCFQFGSAAYVQAETKLVSGSVESNDIVITIQKPSNQ